MMRYQWDRTVVASDMYREMDADTNMIVEFV